MTRTGSQALRACMVLLVASPALAEVQFHQSVDRNPVGTEDTFQLTVEVTDAPDDAQVQLPDAPDFEVLSKSQSTQMSIRMGGGRGGIQRIERYTLVMRANRTGTLIIPPAELVTERRTYRTEPIRMEVKPGRLHDSGTARRPGRPFPDPFQQFPFPDLPEGWDDFGFPQAEIPRSDSDLFLRAVVDRNEVFVGQQVTLSLYIFSRVDLSSVDTVTMPKLDGFWSEDLDSPSQLSGEQRMIDGVPYRAYLIKRRALFPVKAGTLSIEPAEADITTGFLFAGRRVHRKSNALTVKVKALPPGGADSVAVGRWRLSTEVSQTEVNLGEPVTVRVILEGRGNLKNVAAPALTAPGSIKVYDPTTTDKLTSQRGQLGGRKAQEYLLMPQQTGTFTVPGLSLPYFDPEVGEYQVSETDPITLTVRPGENGRTAMSAGGTPADAAAKNVLEAAAARGVRHRARFSGEVDPVWKRPFFVPVALAPLGIWLGSVLVGLLRSSFSREDPSARRRRQAKAARARLAAAEKLRAAGRADEFYGEIERALLSFLEAKLGTPVGGLTREAIAERLTAAGVPEAQRQRVLTALETCDLARFAPGGAAAARDRALDEAAAAMQDWE